MITGAAMFGAWLWALQERCTLRAAMRLCFRLLLYLVTLLPHQPAAAEPLRMPAAPLRTAFGSRCAKSPIACNRIDVCSKEKT